MIEFLKYMKGYLRIRVSGFSPERFMNLCSNKGILLWDIVREGDVYYMCINLRGFWELRPVVKKTGTRVAVLERYGLPFFLPKLLKRKVFVAGLILTIGFWIISSFYIWDIELEGNYQITEDVFGDFLKEQQVSVGMRKEDLDIGALEKEIRRRFPQVTWASARLTGTKLRIDIKENDAPIIVEQPETTEGKDLISDYSGTVVAMIVRSGVPKVAIGDTVEQGTLLVEGKVPIYNEDTTIREYQYVNADADIILEHTMEFSTSLSFDHVEKEYTGREKQSFYLKFGEKSYKLPEERPYQIYDSLIRESRPTVFEKLSIPIFWGEVTHREYQNKEYIYTLDEAKEILNQKLRDFIASLEEKGVQIIEKNVRIDTEENQWVVRGEFVVREPIGKMTETEKVEQTPDSEGGLVE
ncbi:MAG: sporulation protein YqfD [Lachnospiraceae bacterium]|nr:sporulation protein YqfD [Lachnospiraceae bacterium]